MYIATRLFGIQFERDPLGTGRWFERCLGIGFLKRENRLAYENVYRYGFWSQFWLIPNFIWEITVIGVEAGALVTQKRIVGLSRWPRSFQWYK